jgi:hypothetical protein
LYYGYYGYPDGYNIASALSIPLALFAGAFTVAAPEAYKKMKEAKELKECLVWNYKNFILPYFSYVWE